MDKIKNIVIAALVAGFLTATGFFVVTSVTQKPNTDTQSPKFGALAGPDIPSQYLQWGGVYLWNFGPSINSATSSVLCAIQNTQGTSTVDMLGLRVDTNGMGQQVFDVSTSSSQYASSSPAFIATKIIPATINTGKSFTAAWRSGSSVSTSTPKVLGAPDIVGTGRDGSSLFVWNTGDYITFRIATSTGGTFASYMTGNCSVRATKI